MKTNHVKIFQKLGQEVRAVTINGQLWFVASDVCKMFGHSNTSRELENLPERNKTRLKKTSNGYQVITDNLSCIVKTSDSAKSVESKPLTIQISSKAIMLSLVNLAGVSRLCARSNSEEAEILHDWIFEELVPQAMEKGSLFDVAAFINHTTEFANSLPRMNPGEKLNELPRLKEIQTTFVDLMDKFGYADYLYQNFIRYIAYASRYEVLSQIPENMLEKDEKREMANCKMNMASLADAFLEGVPDYLPELKPVMSKLQIELSKQLPDLRAINSIRKQREAL